MRESTALGAAIAAGIATGIWEDVKAATKAVKDEMDTFHSEISDEKRASQYALWNRAIVRASDWVKD